MTMAQKDFFDLSSRGQVFSTTFDAAHSCSARQLLKIPQEKLSLIKSLWRRSSFLTTKKETYSLRLRKHRKFPLHKAVERSFHVPRKVSITAGTIHFHTEFKIMNPERRVQHQFYFLMYFCLLYSCPDRKCRTTVDANSERCSQEIEAANHNVGIQETKGGEFTQGEGVLNARKSLFQQVVASWHSEDRCRLQFIEHLCSIFSSLISQQVSRR